MVSSESTSQNGSNNYLRSFFRLYFSASFSYGFSLIDFGDYLELSDTRQAAIDFVVSPSLRDHSASLARVSHVGVRYMGSLSTCNEGEVLTLAGAKKKITHARGVWSVESHAFSWLWRISIMAYSEAAS